MDEIVVGTYEGFLLGYSLQPEDDRTILKQTFATSSHTAAVRCLSIAGKFLASGGTDDKVVIIDLKTRKEHTVLMNHDGTVNTVAFTNGGTHLLTGSDDGSVIVTRTGNWQIEKIWKKAHGGQPVTTIVVHPSDKLALSIGGDKTLRTWNLIKGRPAFTINLGSKGVGLPTEIKFSPSGDRFSLISLQNVDVWTISKAGLEKRLTCNSKPSTTQWTNDDELFVGLENGNIIKFTISKTKAQTYQAYKQRVKCMHYENSNLYSASSNGVLKAWHVDDDNLQEICSTNISCRVTCIALNRQRHLIKKEENGEDDGKASGLSDNEDKSNESDDSEIVERPPAKRQPGAFVKISYDENNIESPPAKKTKRKKKNKKKNKTE
ncbi:p21-activated protein kinase-interacting protein 1-like [Danaus plexippus]|uniref:p21-activated protein kinase-interacting protein 1-like n=1 Tax=Danaus plexippus TaxID=13037 RepID=UPI002AB2CFF4|nr:p21-activated protein kinase-interacting protein 1-like [Danaus plexippus]